MKYFAMDGWLWFNGAGYGLDRDQPAWPEKGEAAPEVEPSMD